jgi:hypothetical protein
MVGPMKKTRWVCGFDQLAASQICRRDFSRTIAAIAE